MNHTHLPKVVLLPDSARWDKKGTKGDCVNWEPTILEWPVHVTIMWSSLFDAYQPIHISVCKKNKEYSDDADHMRHHRWKFSCLGQQKVVICACLNRSPVTGIDNAKTTPQHANHRLEGPSLLQQQNQPTISVNTLCDQITCASCSSSFNFKASSKFWCSMRHRFRSATRCCRKVSKLFWTRGLDPWSTWRHSCLNMSTLQTDQKDYFFTPLLTSYILIYTNNMHFNQF